MKHLIFIALVTCMFGLASTEASELEVVNIAVSVKNFDLKTESVNKIASSSEVIFKFKVNQPKNFSSNAVIWKARVYCADRLNIGIKANKNNYCGKKVDVTSLVKNQNLEFYFRNPTPGQDKFSIALKSYDASGKWIYTDEERFVW